MSKYQSFISVGALPALMGLGHLVPVIGTIHAVTGSYKLPLPLLGMIGGSTMLVDAFDKYKDLEPSKRPPKWAWTLWACFLLAVMVQSTISSGLEAAICMYKYFALGILWGRPCVVSYTKSSGFQLRKPKTLFREGKSLIAAFCLANVTSGTAMAYYCHAQDALCSSEQSRVLGLAMVYQLLRETTCDVRDIAEDAKEGMKTLPVRLGKANTMMLLATLGFILDLGLTQAVTTTSSYRVLIKPDLVCGSLVRVLGTALAYWKILDYPKGHLVSWGCMSIFGLAAFFWAQAVL